MFSVTSTYGRSVRVRRGYGGGGGGGLGGYAPGYGSGPAGQAAGAGAVGAVNQHEVNRIGVLLVLVPPVVIQKFICTRALHYGQLNQQ